MDLFQNAIKVYNTSYDLQNKKNLRFVRLLCSFVAEICDGDTHLDVQQFKKEWKNYVKSQHLLEERMAKIIELNNTKKEWRDLAYLASDLIEEYLIIEDENKHLEKPERKISDFTLVEYMAHLGAGRMQEVNINQLMTLLCKFTEQLDSEEHTVKL